MNHWAQSAEQLKISSFSQMPGRRTFSCCISPAMELPMRAGGSISPLLILNSFTTASDELRQSRKTSLRQPCSAAARDAKSSS